MRKLFDLRKDECRAVFRREGCQRRIQRLEPLLPAGKIKGTPGFRKKYESALQIVQAEPSAPPLFPAARQKK